MPDSNDIIFNSYGPDLFAVGSNLSTTLSDSSWWAGIYNFLVNAWEIYSILAFIVSGILIVGIIYAYLRFNQLSEIEMDRLLEAEAAWQEVYGDRGKDNDWRQIQKHIDSGRPNDWKLAIIEADIMLEKVLDNAGYAGNTIGDKLKSASPTSFTTLQDAWDAHLIRNKIAHQGADFVLTQRTAQEAIIKYQRVFKEFEAL